MASVRQQHTIQQPVTVAGFGYWSGENVRVEFRPATAGTGITFVRDDLEPAVRIDARCDNRIEIPRRTCLANNSVRVDMVEHILAALAGLQIDNCEVGVDQPEMPGCDGSAAEFIAALKSAGRVAQEAPVTRLRITEPVRLTDGNCWIEATPHVGPGLVLEYTVDYPNDPVIGCQAVSIELTPELFCTEIAPCRTFVLQREAEAMLRQGLGLRVRNQDLLLFDDDGPVDNALRFENECARHKALDVLGDLALTRCEIVGRIAAYRSGHRLNVAFARELVRRFAEQTHTSPRMRASA